MVAWDEKRGKMGVYRDDASWKEKRKEKKGGEKVLWEYILFKSHSFAKNICIRHVTWSKSNAYT